MSKSDQPSMLPSHSLFSKGDSGQRDDELAWARAAKSPLLTPPVPALASAAWTRAAASPVIGVRDPFPDMMDDALLTQSAGC